MNVFCKGRTPQLCRHICQVLSFTLSGLALPAEEAIMGGGGGGRWGEGRECDGGPPPPRAWAAAAAAAAARCWELARAATAVCW